MNLYRCFLSGNESTPAGWKSVGCADDIAARQSAIRILKGRPEIRQVEVWRGPDLAFRLNRSALQPTDR